MKVYIAAFDVIDDVLRVHEIEVKPWGKDEYQVVRGSGVGRGQRLAKGRVCDTPEAAIEPRARCSARLSVGRVIKPEP